jgi:hypothetical protein
MNLKQLRFASTRPASSSGLLGGATRHQSDTPVWRHALSRRQFLGSAVGAAGLVLGWRPGLAQADGSKGPVPIPGGLIIGGEHFHVWGPGAFGPANQDPSTITDFDGFVGLAFISGMVTETNVKTGVSRRLPFLSSDMRFMQGFYRNGKGRVRAGTFALV